MSVPVASGESHRSSSNFRLGSVMEKIFVAGISRFSFQPVSITLLIEMQTTTNGLKPTDH